MFTKNEVYNTINLNKFSSGVYIDKLVNISIIKGFWWAYFIIFRAINNKMLNPYNFIHVSLKFASHLSIITNRGGLDYSLIVLLVFNISLIWNL